MSTKITYVLYADDDPEDLHIFSRSFIENFSDRKLMILTTCDEVVNYLEHPKTLLPGLIFLNLNMMGNQKFECLKHLKKTLRTKDIPVVIYSKAQIAGMGVLANRIGAYKYIVKPNTFTDGAIEIKKIFFELENN